MTIINNLIIIKMVDFKNESIGGGAGYGFGGGQGGGTFLGFLLGSVLSRNGGLFGGNGNEAASSPTLQYQAGFNAGENGKYRDIVSAQNDVNANILASTNSLSQTVRNVADASFAQVSGVKDAVQGLGLGVLTGFNQQTNLLQGAFASTTNAITEARYSDIANSNALSRQLAESTCQIKTAIDKDGDTTRALINANTTQALRDEVSRLSTLNDFNSRGLFPATGPTVSVIAQNPCGDKHNVEAITNVNNNILALGSTVNQLAQILAATQVGK